MIERKILIGLITSNDYTRQMRPVLDVNLLQSSVAKRLASWCLEYFDIYGRVPHIDIEDIYYRKLKEGLPKDIANEIEQDIFPSLNDEYLNEKFNVSYLCDLTRTHMKERGLLLFSEEIEDLVVKGDITEAERLATHYKPITSGAGDELDLSNEEELEIAVETAFQEAEAPLIKYTGALGSFWNEQLVRGAFVALMAPEKRGKTFWLLELAKRAAKGGAKVAFFQAGDMSQSEQLQRICISLTQKAIKKSHTGLKYSPVKDCTRNQINTCDKQVRECDFGVFEGHSEKELRKIMTEKQLIEAFESNKDYAPCHNCDQCMGVVWFRKVNVERLEMPEALWAVKKYFIKNDRKFRLKTYANGTLSVREIRAVMDIWERRDDFVPDVIVIDYADLLVPDRKTESVRHDQDAIWKAMRGLSQERRCLLITATQTDSKSYDKDRLSMSNFSEDKRKFGHVTAMYGLNQDSRGREKSLGIMALNQIVIRSGASSSEKEVYVLHDFNRGQAYLDSFF